MSDSLARIDRATSAASELLHRLDGLSEWIVRRTGDPDPCSNWSRIVDDSAQADWIAASVDAIRTLAAEAREAFTESESAIRSASTNGCWTARMIDLSERLVNLLKMLGWLDPSPCEPRGRARRVAAGVVASLLE